MNHHELSAWLRLLLTPGIGRTSARKLLATFGLPALIFEQPENALLRVVSAAQALALRTPPPGLTAQIELSWEWLQSPAGHHRILTLGDPLYPLRLLEIEDPPPLLYAVAPPRTWECNALNRDATRCLAMVGSRNPTPQGISNARQFAQTLAQAGLTIVSGMALGIDGAAHAGALDGAPPDALATIAVVGTGLDRVYPSQHRELAHRIAGHGVIVSEFPLGMGPLGSNFPQRNRIISGLSMGTLVVEAALESGSLITARLSVEQGRDVFAIPGSIHATQSRGCHALIKQGAKLVERAEDVLEELQWSPQQPHTAPAAHSSPAGQSAKQLPAAPPQGPGKDAQPTESPILQALGFDTASLDALQARTGLPTPELLAQLMRLELQGCVARLPGGLFQRLLLA